MKKSLKKLLVLALSSNLLLLGLVADNSVNAQVTNDTEEVDSEEEVVESEESDDAEESSEEEAESSDSEEDSADDGEKSKREENDQPYSDAELVEYIKPSKEYDLNKVLTVDEIEEVYENIMDAIEEDSEHLDRDKIVEVAGEPNTEKEASNGEFMYYVAVEDEKVVFIELQTYDNENGNGAVLSRMTRENRTPKMFQKMGILEDELLDIYQADDAVEQLETLVGEPEMIEVFPDVYDGKAPKVEYTWQVIGNEDIPDEEVVGIVGVVEDDKLNNVEYALMADVKEGMSSEEETEEDSSESAE
ncbi:hypothetical protein [Facklamia lactis]|uniref:hypothetical protein n=1 Tax=Facklamia lactis TaxID=2749967 RepID=UPI0018CFDFB9|nr:hypothetical protein [Facklamia lactis]MBG9980954.1 hypothetical protein [Facklamia lactis]